MRLSDMVVYHGFDERRESLIQEQLANGKLKVHPDRQEPDGRSSTARAVPLATRLAIVLALAAHMGSLRGYCRETDQWSSAVCVYKKQYLNGELGTINERVRWQLQSKSNTKSGSVKYTAVRA